MYVIMCFYLRNIIILEQRQNVKPQNLFCIFLENNEKITDHFRNTQHSFLQLTQNGKKKNMSVSFLNEFIIMTNTNVVKKKSLV